jgi:hypothetical protein
MTCREAMKYIAKMYYSLNILYYFLLRLILSHEEFKEKKFEYEITWIC